MLKSDRLVCEKNATKAQPVTNYNLDSSILIVTKLPIVRGKIYNTISKPPMLHISSLFMHAALPGLLHPNIHRENVGGLFLTVVICH